MTGPPLEDARVTRAEDRTIGTVIFLWEMGVLYHQFSNNPVVGG